MITFKLNARYTMKSPCDTNCVWTYEVVGRTAKTVKLVSIGSSGEQVDFRQSQCRVSAWNGVEQVKPLGSYSMAPVLTAEHMCDVQEGNPNHK